MTDRRAAQDVLDYARQQWDLVEIGRTERKAKRMTFTKATKRAAKLRLAFVGPAGSGKTFSALRVARALVGPEGRVAVMDSEHGSASKYADLFEFDVVEPDSFNPRVYIDTIRAAEAQGYDVLIIDSLSHAWMGKDGALEMVDRAAKRYQGNSYAGWRDVTPLHNEMVETMLASKLHLIVTMRSKTEYVVEKDEKTGKSAPRKVGMQPVQRDGLEFEFDVVGDMDQDNTFLVSKTRCVALKGAAIKEPGEGLAETLRAWLSDGAPAVESDAEPQPSLRDRISERIAQLADPAVTLTEKQNRVVKIAQAVADQKNPDPTHLAEAVARLDALADEVLSLNGASA